jgi:hypothetical protein
VMKRNLSILALLAAFATLTAQGYYGYPQPPSVVQPVVCRAATPTASPTPVPTSVCGTSVVGGASPFTFNYGSGCSAQTSGDLQMIAIEDSNGMSPAGMPKGWFCQFQGDGDNTYLCVRQFVSGDSTSAVFTGGGTTDSFCYADIKGWNGNIDSGWGTSANVVQGISTGATTTPTGTTFTTATNGDAIILATVFNRTVASVTPATSFTQIATLAGTAGHNGCDIEMRVQGTAEATGSAHVTLSASVGASLVSYFGAEP